jgi:hypothetical protein
MSAAPIGPPDGARGDAAVWWRWACAAAVVAGAALIALGPIADGDIYWHLAAGQEILRRRALLRSDPFTLSAFGRPWIDVHWLFQLAVAATHQVVGLVGLAIGKAAVVAAGAAIATRAAGRAGGPVARVACAAALLGLLFLARHLLPIRPVIVTLLFIAVALDALEAHRTGAPRARRWLFLLPVVQVVWVNCQGLAPLGPALVASYLAGGWIARARVRRRGGSDVAGPLRPLAGVLALMIAASFVTPYGIDAVALPARLLARLAPGQDNIFGSAIAENIPPFVLERTAPEQIGHFKWVLVGLGAALAAFRPRVHPAHAIVLLGFGALALMANRNVLLFYWVAAPLAAITIAPRAAACLSARAHARAAAGAALAAALAGEIALAGIALAREPAVGSPTPFHFPVESARRLAAAGASGPVFAPDQHGGFLTFTVPALRPYIDTRLVLHSGPEYADYLALFDNPARFDVLTAAEGFKYVVLTTAYPDRYLGLVAHLAASPDWTLIFTDGSEVLFARADVGAAGAVERGDRAAVALDDRVAVDAITADLDARFGARADLLAAARLNLARLLIVVGQSDQAERVLSSADSRAAALLRARGRFAAGELAAAEGLTRILLLQDPRDTRSLALMAQIALDRGLADDGRRWLRQALDADPYDAEARAILARLEGGPPAARSPF